MILALITLIGIGIIGLVGVASLVIGATLYDWGRALLNSRQEKKDLKMRELEANTTRWPNLLREVPHMREVEGAE